MLRKFITLGIVVFVVYAVLYEPSVVGGDLASAIHGLNHAAAVIGGIVRGL